MPANQAPARIEPDRLKRNPLGKQNGTHSNILKWGWYSIAVNIALIALHGVIAFRSGSLAVTAELLHNFVDLASAVVVLIGLKLAMRQSPSFPYGLYKVENLVAVGLSLMIFFTAYEVASNVFFEAARKPVVDVWMLLLLSVSMAIPLIFSHFELRVARSTNSPALAADAREYRVHVYTTGLAFAALLAAWFDFPFDGIAAVVIVLAVAKTGWDLLVDAMRVLLDASLDVRILEEVRKSVEADPAVAEVKWVTGRNAGRFRFVESGVTLRLSEPEKSEVAIARIEKAVRGTVPQIERVLLHIEPRTSVFEKCAVPVADISGAVSEHFGEAPYFAFLTVLRADGTVEEQHIRANPYCREERAKGLRVAEWLVGQKIDRVVVPKSLEGKGPAYVFREAGVSVEFTDVRTVTEMFARR